MLQCPHDVGSLAKAVAFTVEFKIGHRTTRSFRGFDDGAALLRRHGPVSTALEGDQGATATGHVVGRTACAIQLAAFRQSGDQTVQVGGAAEILDYFGGNSCAHTKTAFEPSSSI